MKGVIRIREGRPDDDAACLDVIRCSFATVADELGFRPDTHQAFPAYWTSDRFATARKRDGSMLLAESDTVIVGCCFAGAGSPDTHNWLLKRLAVIPQARHHGVGARLVRVAADHAAAAGVHGLRVRIVASNQRLAAWYLTLGFQLISTSTRPDLPFKVTELELPLG